MKFQCPLWAAFKNIDLISLQITSIKNGRQRDAHAFAFKTEIKTNNASSATDVININIKVKMILDNVISCAEKDERKMAKSATDKKKIKRFR